MSARRDAWLSSFIVVLLIASMVQDGSDFVRGGTENRGVPSSETSIETGATIDLEWIRQFGTPEWDEAPTNAVAADAHGVYFAGWTLPLPDEPSTGWEGWEDGFARKYDAVAMRCGRDSSGRRAPGLPRVLRPTRPEYTSSESDDPS